MTLTKEDIRGIISPLVTPFDEAEDVDLEAFRAEARYVLQFDVSGLLVGAATGEGYSLTPEESGAVYEAAVAVLATPVYYFAPSDDGIYSHYLALWEEAGLPVVVYNSRPDVPVRPDLMERLADIPGVIGVKEGM